MTVNIHTKADLHFSAGLLSLLPEKLIVILPPPPTEPLVRGRGKNLQRQLLVQEWELVLTDILLPGGSGHLRIKNYKRAYPPLFSPCWHQGLADSTSQSSCCYQVNNVNAVCYGKKKDAFFFLFFPLCTFHHLKLSKVKDLSVLPWKEFLY